MVETKKEEIVTVTWEQMRVGGEFDCPKCKIVISPEHDEDWEDITDTKPEFAGFNLCLFIKHTCGQIMKIDTEGCPDEENTRE